MDTGPHAQASEAAPAVAETNPAPPKVWPSLSYHDALRAIEFLVEGLGFVKSGIYLDEQDETSVMHAELLWPEGGGVMLGSAPRPEGWTDPQGHASTYCVVPADEDVDRVHAQAVAAGARTVREPRDEDYGGRTCVLADFEGNHWSIGSYQGGAASS